MKKLILSIAILPFIISNVYSESTSVPSLISYQGTLTNEKGILESGTKTIEFNIYDAEINGNLLWGPQIFSNVALINGQFNVILGSTDTQGRSIADAFDSTNCFIGISVLEGTSDPGDFLEIKPRQQILSTPYSIRTIKAIHHSNIIPVGTVVSYFGIKAPQGWLLCDGNKISEKPEFKALRDLVGINTPDLRGMFLRGLNNSRNDGKEDPDGNDRLLGSYQSDQYRSHRHNLPISANPPGNTWSVEHSDGRGGFNGKHLRVTDACGGKETRPKNVAVNYIIKY